MAKKPKLAVAVGDKSSQKDFDILISSIRSKHGIDCIQVGDETVIKKVEAITTGVFALDIAIGIGGIPRGRIIEIFGPESSGKTTLALHCMAATQAVGGRVAFIDVEHAYDPTYATNLGISQKDVIFSQPDFGEQALQIVEDLVVSGMIDLVVIDSVAALVPKAEIDGEIGDTNIGLQARLMSQACRKLATLCSKSKTTIIFINQIREKIGMMGMGPSTGTPGGRALKFYASVRIEIKRIGKAQNGPKEDNTYGNEVKIKVIKNKVAPPFREAQMDIVFGKGVNNVATILAYADELKLISKKGSHYSYGESTMGNGKAKAVEFLNDNKDIYDKLTKEVFDAKLLKNDLIDINEENRDTIESEDDDEYTDLSD